MLGLALPNGDHPPAKFSECGQASLVTLDVFFKLLHPERDVGLRSVAVATAAVSVPIAAMYHNHRSMASQDYVWPTRERCTVEAETKTKAM